MQMITGIIRIILYREEKSWGWIKSMKVMQDYVKNQEISGAALLVRRGDEILYENRWGYSRCETNQEIKEDSIYRLMSMTKCITAVAVMICIEKGLLELDAPLSRYIPEFAGMRLWRIHGMNFLWIR